jgi:stearoyl-CoA desaturase (delta-9 desaturase)
MSQPWMRPEVGRLRFDVFKSVWMWCHIGVGLILGPLHFSWEGALLGGLLSALTVCFGHSVGLHRGVIHKSYKASPALMKVLAVLCTGLGGPLSWIRVHYYRDVWQNRLDCPGYFAYDHGRLKDFWWNLHYRFEPADEALYKLPEDTMQDPFLRFLEKSWPLWTLGLGLLVAVLLGPAAAAGAVCARVAITILGHWYVGWEAHARGEKPYPVAGAKESGTNRYLLGLLAFGEGWHNTHHAAPSSARFGLGRGEIDLGWWAIRAMQALGLVWEVRRADLHPELWRPLVKPEAA